MADFDLIVIGTGVAGRSAADEAVAAGMSVALIDRGGYGGTCALRGCEPKKVLYAGAEAVERTEGLARAGIVRPASLDWQRLVEFKRGMTDATPPAIEKAYADQGVRLIHGSASFAGPAEVAVDGAAYSAEHILIATGARPMPLGIDGETLVIDSERFMETDRLPERIVFIGGGFISFEFAAMARTAGSDVTILHLGHRPLEQFDADLVAMLVAEYADRGIEVQVDSPVAGVAEGDGGFTVTTGDGSRIDCDLVVHGAGRVPDLADLALERGGVAFGRRGVQVDEQMRSVSNERVFAAGDAADLGIPLTPVGIAQGRIAVRNMVSPGSATFEPGVIPSVVYSYPPLAGVGMTAAEAEAAGAVVKLTDTSGWWSSKRVGLRHTGAKTIVERDTGRILGAHLLGHHADEVVNLFALLIERGMTVEQAKGVLWAYPTASSEIAYLL